MKRVLVVGPVPPPYHGGSVATAHLLSSSLAARFELVHVDTSDRRGLENIGRLDAGNVLHALRHTAEFAGALARSRPDAVYVPVAQHRLAYLRDCAFLLPAQAAGIPVVAHIHGGGFGAFWRGTDAATRALVRRTMRRAARVIVLGEALRGMLDGLVAAERIAVVPNGVQAVDVDPAPASERTGRSRREGPARVRVVYLGTLMVTKGFLDVLRAARLLVADGVDVEFVIAGDYDDAEARRQAEALLAADDALRRRVTLPGVVAGAAKRRLLQDADVFVFPTYYPFEGHPYVILEAMAAGLPVVTTAHAAIPGTVVAGETGAFVPARDPAALADVLRHLIGDAEARRRMGQAGRDRQRREYSIERWSERLGDVLEGALCA